MTPAQQVRAVDLLAETLDWIGLPHLTVAEEEEAERLAERVEGFLLDARGSRSRRPPVTPETVTLARRYLLVRREYEDALREEGRLERLIAYDRALGESEEAWSGDLKDRVRIRLVASRALVAQLQEASERALEALSAEMLATEGSRSCAA